MPATSDDHAGRSGSRRPTARTRLALCIGASVALHGAALAWVTLDVPAAAETPIVVQRIAPLEKDVVKPAEPEPVVMVVEIRPPGVMPSGGASAGSVAVPEASAPAPAPTAVNAPVTPAPRVATAPNRGIVLASAPAAPAALPSMSERGEASTPTTSRPNRGIIQRAPGSGPSTGQRGTGSGSVGGGRGGSGVTTVGRGGDCITAGMGTPEGRTPLTLPNERRGPGMSGGGIGRITRGGR